MRGALCPAWGQDGALSIGGREAGGMNVYAMCPSRRELGAFWEGSGSGPSKPSPLPGRPWQRVRGPCQSLWQHTHECTGRGTLACMHTDLSTWIWASSPAGLALPPGWIQSIHAFSTRTRPAPAVCPQNPCFSLSSTTPWQSFP